MSALIAIVGMVGAAVGIILYMGLSWAFVLWKFYYWFVLPVFATLPEITFIHALGLMLFIELFHNHNPNLIKEEYLKGSKERVMAALLPPWGTFVVGWMIHSMFF